jgi:hypothetical protein
MSSSPCFENISSSAGKTFGHDRFSFHSAYATLRIFLQSPLEEPLGEMRC